MKIVIVARVTIVARAVTVPVWSH